MDALAQIQYTIVGTLMEDPGKVGEALTKLSIADFTYAPARGIYAAIGDLHFAGAPINRITVLHKAGDDYAEAILEASRMYASDLDYYVDQLREKSRELSIKRIAEQILLAKDLDAMEPLIDRLNGAVADRQQVEIVDFEAGMFALLQSLEGPPPEYFKWGMDELDQRLFVEEGDFVILGGYASSGKTMLALQFAITLAKKYRVGFFSLETRPKKLLQRALSHTAQISNRSIKRHALTENDWDAAGVASVTWPGTKLKLIPAAGMTVRDIKATALNQRFDVIFIDYLQIIKVKEKGPRYEKVTSISMELHEMAQSTGIMVFSLAQLSRPDKGSSGKPTMASLRESGQIEQDADVIMLLYPDDEQDLNGPRVLNCCKNKDASRFMLKMNFDGNTQTMRPHDDSKPKPAPPPKQKVPDWVLEAEKDDNISFLEDNNYGQDR